MIYNPSFFGVDDCQKQLGVAAFDSRVHSQRPVSHDSRQNADSYGDTYFLGDIPAFPCETPVEDYRSIPVALAADDGAELLGDGNGHASAGRRICDLIPYLLKEIQSLRKRVAELEDKIK